MEQKLKKLTIGRLAERTNVSTDTLRYYEKMGLIKEVDRSSAGYRIYDVESEQVIQFIKGAKSLNFTLREIKKLLFLRHSDKATCAEVLKHTSGKISEAERKIKELKQVKNILTVLTQECPGGKTSTETCPVLDYIRKGKGRVYD